MAIVGHGLRVVGWLLRGRRRANRTEVEIVVANRRRRVSERVVGGNDRRSFVQVRLERALEHVTGIDQQNGAAVTRARRAEVADVAAEQRQAAAIAALQDTAVEIVGADDRDHDGPIARGAVGGGAGARRRRNQQRCSEANRCPIK